MYYREYEHIKFDTNWKLSDKSLLILGQCDGIVQAIGNTPIAPAHYQRLLRVTFIKGAQSTTAIEGNTLTDKEVEMINEGEKLPPSKQYQEQEVKNILDAFTTLFRETAFENKGPLVSPELLLRFHKMVGKNLGEHFAATPGYFRERDVTVGKYRCPDYRDVKELINQFCEWQRRQFRYEDGNQDFTDIIVQAIVAHVYLEWIHPFSDGNGRTGRLLEFYILLRGGFPNIALHILSNHYNLTRPQYYRELEKATEHRSLSNFIEYALVGFRDGLKQTLLSIQGGQFVVAWKAFIYDKFSEVKGEQKEEALKRRRKLALNFPIDRRFPLQGISKLNVEIALDYAKSSERTLMRDVEELVSMKILMKNEEDNTYSANIAVLKSMVARSRLKNMEEKKSNDNEIS